MGTIVAALEQAGIPTASVVNERMDERFMAGVLQSGYPDIAHVLVNENQLYTKDTGQKLADVIYPNVVAGLTAWKPEYLKQTGDKWVPTQSEFSFEGATYEAALEAMNKNYLSDMFWGDGLPLLPPTQEKVDWLLTGTPLPKDTVIGKWGPSSAEFTVEKIAINAAMAGARPEYMPVILAAMESITSVKWENQTFVMKSPVPLIVVNGPMAAEIGLNSGSGVFGPNPLYPANASIGRAINLSMRNIGGSGRGFAPSNLAGNPGSYAGVVIAEAEDIMALGKGWDPLHVQLGYKADQNIVTVLGIESMDMSISGGFPNAMHYPAPNTNNWPATTEAFQKRTAGVLVVPELTMVLESGLVDDPRVKEKGYTSGLTKEALAEMLYKQARIPRDEFNALFLTGPDGKPIEAKGSMKDLLATLGEKDSVPIGAGPDNFLVLAAGGH